MNQGICSDCNTLKKISSSTKKCISCTKKSQMKIGECVNCNSFSVLMHTKKYCKKCYQSRYYQKVTKQKRKEKLSAREIKIMKYTHFLMDQGYTVTKKEAVIDSSTSNFLRLEDEIVNTK